MSSKQNKLRLVDLFAGGGGMSLGFEQAGFEVVSAFENWEPACANYRANFPHHALHNQDLSDVKGSAAIIEAHIPDVVIGGPPCQDFSSAGKRDESLGRADLTVAFAEIVSRVRPRYFVMENVARSAGSNALKKAITILKKSGYGLSMTILDASLCGVPQARKRFFLIGGLEERDQFLEEPLQRFLNKNPMTLRDYFGKRLKLEHYYRHPRSYARRGIFSIDEPSPTIRGVNRPLPEGYVGHPGDAVAVSAAIRPLTTRERASIQTFPEEFVLVGTKTDVEQVIGNAVPVKLAQYVAERLLNHIAQRQLPHSTPTHNYQLFDPAKDTAYGLTK
jgi:DNA (cytosine-5)-methyltransferase 1